MHPRTLNRYLQELLEYGYIHITGGKKQRTGYLYTLTPANERKAIEAKINQQIQAVMQRVWKAHEAKQKKVKTNKAAHSHQETTGQTA